MVVGPNGSGKSNITDAVLWAMGEQSPLAVRGQSMQDVIFGGGRGVQARSAAEVEIVLDNSDGTVELPLSEISILRRLDRSGEGDYRLNGARCRLVDVIELLSDTGLGKETHSVISQGRVEAIVTSKPRDRRLLDRGGRRPRQAPQAPPPRPAEARAHPGEPRPRAGRRARGARAAAAAQAPGRGRGAARAPRAPDARGAPGAGARRSARPPPGARRGRGRGRRRERRASRSKAACRRSSRGASLPSGRSRERTERHDAIARRALRRAAARAAAAAWRAGLRRGRTAWPSGSRAAREIELLEATPRRAGQAARRR